MRLDPEPLRRRPDAVAELVGDYSGMSRAAVSSAVRTLLVHGMITRSASATDAGTGCPTPRARPGDEEHHLDRRAIFLHGRAEE
ncbi:hypothetical protein CQ042_11825 [Microbacterium sp. MYb62]|nr:hypothetical protein CQ042_11825 [Microbacterium sp. MYb62]